jgi:hypothetical protein
MNKRMGQTMIRVHRSQRTLVAPLALVLWTGLVMATPGYAQIAVTSPSLVERVAAPGETYRDTITIRNSSNAIQTVSLSLSDYLFDAEGSTQFDQPGSQPRSNTGWVTLGQRTVTLLPHADLAVNYTVAVPAGTPPPFGTYWSVVLVEVEHSIVASSMSTGLSVVPRLRYAVQVATHVGKTGEPTLAFGQPHLLRSALSVGIMRVGASYQTPAESTLAADRSLSIDITHVGTRACRPAIRMEVYQQDGTLVHSATAQRGLLYPGSSLRQTFGLPPLPTGDYTVLLLADVGTDKVQGTKFQIHVQ